MAGDRTPADCRRQRRFRENGHEDVFPSLAASVLGLFLGQLNGLVPFVPSTAFASRTCCSPRWSRLWRSSAT